MCLIFGVNPGLGTKMSVTYHVNGRKVDTDDDELIAALAQGLADLFFLQARTEFDQYLPHLLRKYGYWKQVRHAYAEYFKRITGRKPKYK
jgi:hypothetical protein